VRVFADTNVLVAAFATRGLCADVLRTILAEHELLVSAKVTPELTRILVDKIRVPEPTMRQIAGFVRASASAVGETPPGPSPVRIRDPDDAAILGAALAMGAEVLVTGDKDLLEAADVPGIRILDPRGFWQLVRERGR
jgi:putative PIN family toxin of toxin-antitoxin system